MHYPIFHYLQNGLCFYKSKTSLTKYPIFSLNWQKCFHESEIVKCKGQECGSKWESTWFCMRDSGFLLVLSGPPLQGLDPCASPSVDLVSALVHVSTQPKSLKLSYLKNRTGWSIWWPDTYMCVYVYIYTYMYKYLNTYILIYSSPQDE